MFYKQSMTTTMNDKTVWLSKQKKVCDQLQDPSLHRRIKKCLEDRDKHPNVYVLQAVEAVEVDYGLMMLHCLYPSNFNNDLQGYEGIRRYRGDRPYRLHPCLMIGSLLLLSFGRGIRVVYTKRTPKGIRMTDDYRSNKIPLVEVIRSINVATGAGIGGRQVEGLDKMTFTEAYQTFMKLPEFEEE